MITFENVRITQSERKRENSELKKKEFQCFLSFHFENGIAHGPLLIHINHKTVTSLRHFTLIFISLLISFDLMKISRISNKIIWRGKKNIKAFSGSKMITNKWNKMKKNPYRTKQQRENVFGIKFKA